MENLITPENFNNTIYQVYAGGSDAIDIFDNVITEYQRPILINILGQIEYDAFETDLNDTDEATLIQWQYFLEGTTYTHNSISYVYPGIRPILVKFIYYYWQRETYNWLAERGALKPTYKNSSQIVPETKMITAYNKACDEIYNNKDYSPTVYRFLYDMNMDNGYFPDWDYTNICKINPFGI